MKLSDDRGNKIEARHPMKPADLSKPWLIDCCKDGTLTARRRGQRPFNGAALPVYSVDTLEDAESLIIAVAKLQYVEHPLLPRQPWYRLHDFDGEVTSLLVVTDKLAAIHSRWQS